MTEHSLTELISDPSKYFQAPADVLLDKHLTDTEKLQVLEAWREDADQLARATSENMGGGEKIDLASVDAAIEVLEKK